MTGLRTATLLVATLTTGLAAGLFTTFSYAVMPGLARADDREFVEVMQRINVAILNPWFGVVFGGALLSTAVAAAFQVGRPALRWTAGAVILYAIVLLVTFGVSVPLNNRLAAAGAADPAVARAMFEAPWVRWNLVRAMASTASFACATTALLVHGRTG
ncbi:MAG: DUF1772 domain-containing protein [Pseudonocardia sp.]|nr:DUF1772 domain-containing protein [Pseudonocardia sp.]